MPAYERLIPNNAYDAERAVGVGGRLSIDRYTSLVRSGTVIRLMYRGDELFRWSVDGTARLTVRYAPGHSSGWTPEMRRQACALPDEWALDVGSRLWDGRRRRPRLVYRGAWVTEVTTLTFCANGGIRWARSAGPPELTATQLDNEVSAIQGFDVMRSRRRNPRPLPSYARNREWSLAPEQADEPAWSRMPYPVSPPLPTLRARLEATYVGTPTPPTSEQLARWMVELERMNQSLTFVDRVVDVSEEEG